MTPHNYLFEAGKMDAFGRVSVLLFRYYLSYCGFPCSRTLTLINRYEILNVVRKIAEVLKRSLLGAFILRPLEIGPINTKTPTATAPPFYVVLPENQARKSILVDINLPPGQSPYTTCWYPISVGEHSLLSLQIPTIPKGQLLPPPSSPLPYDDTGNTRTSHHPWLRAATLAATLTHSGATAIHAYLISWSRKAFGGLDTTQGRCKSCSTQCVSRSNRHCCYSFHVAGVERHTLSSCTFNSYRNAKT